MKNLQWLAIGCLVLTAHGLCCAAPADPQVVIETNFGDIVVELFHLSAPVTVDNFLDYVNSGFYDGLIFHRIMENFMIQGGGFYIQGNVIYYRQPGAPIINESFNGISNTRGTIAMARSDDPNSATSQFFINHADNPFLDRQNAEDGFGYCVFGHVVEGMDVVDQIAAWPDCYVNEAFKYFPCYQPVDIYRTYVRPCGAVGCSDAGGNGGVDFVDFAVFARYWLDEDCRSANDFCGGADMDYNGRFDSADLALFSENWLAEE